MKKIIVYTDGSCLGNPGPGGWAWLALEEKKTGTEKISYDSGGESHTTNNRMEMTALLQALHYLTAKHRADNIAIFSDSNLLVQTINQGWKKKANLDLWLEIERLLPQVDFKISWVKAHHQDPHNIQCDKLALAAAEKIKKTIGLRRV
jgi:ribonuclease HI